MRYRGVQTLRNLLNVILDVILPRKERAMRTEKRSVQDLALSPIQHELLGITITTLMDYSTPEVRDAIRTLKYDGTRAAAKLLADALADYLREEIASMRAFSPRPILLVPVPLHRDRVRERGFNQMERVLEALPDEFKDGTLSKVVPSALMRTKATPQQTRLSRAERLRNVQEAFITHDVQKAHVIVVDDVTTTGATLAECARTLKKAGAKVTALALARA